LRDAKIGPHNWRMSCIQWTENLTCPRCGKAGKVTFSGPAGFRYLKGEKDRVKQGSAGFETEAVEFGFIFRCVDCNTNARVTKAN
jgi:hypothetical protein